MVNSIILSGMAWASSLKNAVLSHIQDERGQDFVEYAVLAGAISLVGAAAVLFWGSDIKTSFEGFASKVNGCLGLDSGSCV